MEDKKEESLNDDNSKINQHLDKIKSGLETTRKKVVKTSKKAVEVTSKLTSDAVGKVVEKKEKFIEKRQKKREEFVESLREDEKYKQIIADNEKLPKMISIPVEEHENLVQDIRLLEKKVEELELQIKSNNIELESKNSEIESKNLEIESINSEIVESKTDINPEEKSQAKKERGIGGEVNRSINQILVTLGFSVLWAIILIAIDFQLQDREIELSGMGTKAIVWPFGTAIWSLFLLSSQSKAGTLLSMDWSNRIKTSIGVGLVTTLSLMLTDGEMKGITNVWGWAMTIALCAFLLSGFFRGLLSSLRNLTRWIRPKQSTD